MFLYHVMHATIDIKCWPIHATIYAFKIESFYPYVLYTERYLRFLELPSCHWPRGRQTTVESLPSRAVKLMSNNQTLWVMADSSLSIVRRAKIMHVLTLVVYQTRRLHLEFLFKTPLSLLRSPFVCSDHKPDSLSSRRWRNVFEQRRGGSYDHFLTVPGFISW